MTDVVEILSPPSVLTQIVGPEHSATVEIIGAVPALLTITEPIVQLVEVITPGPQGPQGPPGPQGPYGQRQEITKTFAVPAFVWTIPHTFGGHPDVTTYDQNGDEVIGDVTHPDTATVVVTFAVELAGMARLTA